jgi:hypothetical protein
MTTKRKLRIPKHANVDDTVDAINKWVRGELRRTLAAEGREWRPVWIRYPTPGRCQIQRTGDADLDISLDDLPEGSRRLVAALLDLLDEQAWMARVARQVSAEFAERDSRVAAKSKVGGSVIAERYARPDLDDLIRGCLQRGERTRLYTKEWAVAFNVSVDTIERRIKRVKADIAKG